MTVSPGPPESPRSEPQAQAGGRESCPDSAAVVFGDHLPLAQRYADLLCDDGVLRGLVGPREPERIWTRHLLNSAALAPFIPPAAEVVDLGSGAGLPGIPLLLARPDLRMTLLEPQLRRVRFLTDVRERLGIEVTIERARAEAASVHADVVVARAVAPLDQMIDLALPLLRPGGSLLAQKGAQVEAEVAAAESALARWPHARLSVHSLSAGDTQTSLVHVVLSPEALPWDGVGKVRQQRSRRGMR